MWGSFCFLWRGIQHGVWYPIWRQVFPRFNSTNIVYSELPQASATNMFTKAVKQGSMSLLLGFFSFLFPSLLWVIFFFGGGAFSRFTLTSVLFSMHSFFFPLSVNVMCFGSFPRFLFSQLSFPCLWLGLCFLKSPRLPLLLFHSKEFSPSWSPIVLQQ